MALGLGFYGPATADMARWGAMRGPVHGYLVSELGDAEKDKTKFAWSVFIGATEASVGGVAAHGLRMTRGRAELAGAGFAALYPAMAKQARSATVGLHLQFSVNPLAAAPILGGSRGQAPLASVSYRF